MEAEPEPLPERVGSDSGCLNVLLKIAHLQLFGGVADVTILELIGRETQRHVANLASYDLLRGDRSGALAFYSIPPSAVSAVAGRLTDALKQEFNREFAQILVPYLQRVPDNWPIVQNLIALAKATLASLGRLPWPELAPVLQRLDLGPHLREIGPELFPRLAFDDANAPVEAKAMYGRCLAAHERYDAAIPVLGSLSTGSDGAVSAELPVRQALAECFRKTGRFPDGVAILEPWEESQPAPGSEQPRLQRQAWSTLGKCHLGQGQHRRALSAFDKAISIGIPVHNRTLSDLLGVVDAWRGRNIVLRDEGRYRVALAEAIRLTSLIKTCEIRSAQAYVARTLTTCNLMLLRFEEALDHNRFAHDVAKALRHRSLLANCIWGDAEIARYSGDLQLATRLYAQALEIYEAIPDVQGVIYVHLGMADAHLKQGDYYLAASHYVKADELAAEHTCHLERLHVRGSGSATPPFNLIPMRH
jgi:tetratricopeptide (TPR) repeat protein